MLNVPCGNAIDIDLIYSHLNDAPNMDHRIFQSWSYAQHREAEGDGNIILRSPSTGARMLRFKMLRPPKHTLRSTWSEFKIFDKPASRSWQLFNFMRSGILWKICEQNHS